MPGEDVEEEADPAASQTLLSPGASRLSMYTWEGAAALIRNISGSQQYMPLDKVKRLRDFANVLSAHYQVTASPRRAGQQSCRRIWHIGRISPRRTARVVEG